MSTSSAAVLPIEEHRGDFQKSLLDWFESARRNFPWRERFNDPYAILVAEKLLQQTVARNAVQAYEEMLRRYPTPDDLAAADVADVEVIVQPLGFIYRARELIAMAQALVNHHRGEVPRTLKELLALPGVGDYAARAILSFVFGEDVAVVDTNVARLFYRLYGTEGPLPANPARKRSLIELAGSLVPQGQAREWNLAILDFCALICKPSNPQCEDCPVRRFCVYGTNRVAST